MKTPQKITFFLLTLLLAACNLPGNAPQAASTADPGIVGTIAAMTLEAIYSSTPATTATPKPTITVTMTVTPTYEPPVASFEGSTNCREGPGTEYASVTVIKAGQKTDIVGLPPKGNYWIVKNPNGEGSCWVAGDYAKTTGSVQSLPTVIAPPTPTPVPPKAPAWKNWNFNCEFASGGSNLTINLAWTDRSDNEQGYNIYRNDELLVALGPDSAAYTDVALVTAGQAVTYVVEAYNQAGGARSSPVQASCQ